MTLWEVEIQPAANLPNRKAEELASQAADLGLADNLAITAAYGYLIQGEFSAEDAQRIAADLLVDPVAESCRVQAVGDGAIAAPPAHGSSAWNAQPAAAESATLVQVLPKAGVTDAVAESVAQAMNGLNVHPEAVRTFQRVWITGADEQQTNQLVTRLLANDSVEQAVIGPLPFKQLEVGVPYEFDLQEVPLRTADDEQMEAISRAGQLSLSLTEMQTIQAHYRKLDRDPTDIELETVAQTWSEHCSHKTLAGRIEHTGPAGEQTFENMLKETIFAATQQLRKELGDDDWCVSVFKDNAGIVKFTDDHNIAFKVETHNRPSAIEPYGGANTGIGGVIRDTLGTGLGARPVCNTDVFCFAPPETAADSLPPGVLHPRRVMRGVVAGVRDYGNRMGIPTVNGAIYFDDRYIGNPLVFCGNVGVLPHDMSFKEPQAGDYIVAMGGRTGRDGIHGATFSSAELTSESEKVSGGSVQIGNAITEKMVLDVLIAARDRGLYTAVTDCGAGGFSSAVGEMGEELGAEVDLEKAPLKYAGLSYTEIWISEAQERMVFSVPPAKWPELQALAESEGVEATVIGTFADHGRLVLRYHGTQVADMSMKFLHDGRPPVVRQSVYKPVAAEPLALSEALHPGESLKKILGSLNVASKEWVIRQYDHEVQGGSVIKPLVGIASDGPSDAAVVRPLLDSRRGVVIGCGMNPHYGDLSAYDMAASAIDEAIRNCVAVGADPDRIAVLDNFCWGNTDRPSTLGSLVEAALACNHAALAMRAPFISGKDSLKNEFRFTEDGKETLIAIPPTLLISAMGQIADVAKCITMDLKQAGNFIYQIGVTENELGGSHFALVNGLSGGTVPKVDFEFARRVYLAMYQAIDQQLVRSCHDMSEGGLAVCAAEMAFAGGLGMEISQLDTPPFNLESDSPDLAYLFSESNTRFLVEVEPAKAAAFESALSGISCQQLGVVADHQKLVIKSFGETLIEEDLATLKAAWQAPLNW